MKILKNSVHQNRVYKNLSGLEYRIHTVYSGGLCVVEFCKTKFKDTVDIRNAVAGKVKDYLSPSVAQIGILGKKREWLPKERILWKNMLNRVQYHKDYQDCKVCDRWLTLDNFSEDIRKFENYQAWLYDTSSWHLDKDIKYPGNKVYSPQTCLFVEATENLKDSALRQIKRIEQVREYKAIHNDGTEITFCNQRKFANDYGLDYRNVNRSIKNHTKTKGWSIKEITNQD